MSGCYYTVGGPSQLARRARFDRGLSVSRPVVMGPRAYAGARPEWFVGGPKDTRTKEERAADIADRRAHRLAVREANQADQLKRKSNLLARRELKANEEQERAQHRSDRRAARKEKWSDQDSMRDARRERFESGTDLREQRRGVEDDSVAAETEAGREATRQSSEAFGLGLEQARADEPFRQQKNKVVLFGLVAVAAGGLWWLLRKRG